LRRFNGTKNFDIISKKEVSRVGNYIAYVVNKCIEDNNNNNNNNNNNKTGGATCTSNPITIM
jgi:hypothetical protein